MRRLLLCFLALAGCASVPDPPAPGLCQVWGQLRLVPHEGVTPGRSGAAAYGDRRLRDVEFVDYSRPGFAVVYVAEAAAPAGELAFAIRSTRVGTRIEPTHGAVGAAGSVVVHNDSAEAHIFSYPAAGVVQAIAPGERVSLAVPRPGEQGIFVLDAPDAGATLFAAPGRFHVASPAGRYRLTDLAPGSREIRVWHPRFPPATQRVELAPDASVRIDFELGVGRDGYADAD